MQEEAVLAEVPQLVEAPLLEGLQQAEGVLVLDLQAEQLLVAVVSEVLLEAALEVLV